MTFKNIQGSVSYLAFLLLFFFSAGAHAATVSCTTAATNQWIPSKGYAWVDSDNQPLGSGNPTHYIYQYVYWDSPNRLTWFASNSDSTYEPDAFFYNYDGDGTWGYEPQGYWESDLPSPYLDTQLFDGENEKAITVGSANAQAINSGSFYTTFTRMTLRAGPGISDTPIKLSSQRGRRVPSGCYGANCSFGCSSSNNYRTVPFQSGYTGPGAPNFDGQGREWFWQYGGTYDQPW